MVKLKLLIFLLIVLSSVTARALTYEFTAHVTYVQLDGENNLYIGVDKEVRHNGCFQRSVRVPSGHSQIDRWMQMALHALESGSEISIRTTNCSGGFPIPDEAPAAWVRINAKQ